MELYLLRHAIALEREEFKGDDSERPLTPEGKKKMRRIAKGLQALEISFDVLLSSPYRRAQETADMVAARFNIRRHLQLTDALTPRGNRQALIQEIAAFKGRAESIGLVGHEPYLSTLAATLIFGRPVAGLNLKKGGVLKLTLDGIRFGRCAELDWLLTPRQLMAMAD
ncbi:MAG TPA: phosphohistidine phosphatase SixA [Candidatus Limnocylindria bacterium]|nr:phosphohistidine phosphatase SixA [Candidatus Limnocylindria bacterium]